MNLDIKIEILAMRLLDKSILKRSLGVHLSDITLMLCGGGSICSHKIQRRDCKICNPTGHLASIVRNRIYQALKHAKDLHSVEYLDCIIDIFKQHIESQFKEGMTWENHGNGISIIRYL